MFGSGATYPKDRIAFHVWEHLSEAGIRNTLVVNGSEHGTNSHELLKRCKDHLYLFRPSIVLINLSTNDATAQFHEGLQALLDWTKAIGSKVIFIQEANTIEIQRGALLKKHGIMSEIAMQAKAPVFGLNQFMSQNDIYDSGILWWDPVHMTSYGQRKAAEYLSQKLIETGFLNATAQ
jgi:lysophospholipase L1-like esterase